MLAHTKRRPIKQVTYKVTIEMPGKTKRSALVSSEHMQKLENFLDKYGESDSIPWEKLAEDRIKKYGKPAIALRGARYREGLSQKELARRTGITQDNISKMENGKRVIGEKVAKKLAKALNIDFEHLIDVA
jgi:ribosome-binding protein aMBF1 (putative translation factor)